MTTTTSPTPLPPELATDRERVEEALTQARMAQKQWGLASKMLVEGYGIDEHLAAVVDALAGLLPLAQGWAESAGDLPEYSKEVGHD